MAATVPAASAVTAGSGPGAVPASACWSPAAPSAGAGWPASADPGVSAAGCPSPEVLVLGASAGGASAAGASGAAAGVQVSAMPGLLP